MNYFTPILSNFYEKLTDIEGNLFLLKYISKNFSGKLNFNENDNIGALASFYRDLSVRSGDNLIPTGFSFEFSKGNLDKKLLLLLNRECCYSISKTYELFEKFLKNFLRSLIKNNDSYYERVHDIVKKNLKTDDAISLINTLQRKDKNNKSLLRFIRNNFEVYKNNEVTNYFNIDLKGWFNLISEIRHSIIHDNSAINEKVLLSINSNKNIVYYKKFFNYADVKNKIITTDHFKTSELLHLFNQFAFLIYKSISVELGLPLDFTDKTVLNG